MAAKPCTPTPFNTALLTTTIVFICLATLAVSLRFLATHHADGRALHRLDTWLLIAALVLCYGLMIQTICGCATTGINCYHSDLDPEWAEREAKKILWSDMFLLIPASALVKMSVLEYYKRIFLGPRCKWICNTMIFLCAAWAISTIFAQGFSSTPISKSWNHDATEDDYNYDYRAFILAIAGINIPLDFITLYTPLPLLVKLHTPVARLAKICGIFAIGSFCLICAIMRFYYADRQFSDLSDDMAHRARVVGYVAMWGRLEPLASIIAACVPTFGPLVCSRFFMLEIFLSHSFRNSSKTLNHGDLPVVKVNRASSATITHHHVFDDPTHPHHHVSIHSTSRPTSHVAVPGQISVEYEFTVNSERSSATAPIAEEAYMSYET